MGQEIHSYKYGLIPIVVGGEMWELNTGTWEERMESSFMEIFKVWLNKALKQPVRTPEQSLNAGWSRSPPENSSNPNLSVVLC